MFKEFEVFALRFNTTDLFNTAIRLYRNDTSVDIQDIMYSDNTIHFESDKSRKKFKLAFYKLNV